MLRGATRRQFVMTGVLGATGIATLLSSCADGRQSSSPTEGPTMTGPGTASTPSRRQSKALIVYFSRAGENYFNGGRRNLTVGNTEVLAAMIRDRLDCDIYRVEPADPYPTSYDDTVQRNVEEEEADARPLIAGTLPSLDGYDPILLGSPVWNVRAPMIMWTFAEGVDLSGKTILPFVTYAVSGMGSVEDDYRSRLEGATVGRGLAVRGETVGGAESELNTWLRSHRLARAGGAWG